MVNGEAIHKPVEQTPEGFTELTFSLPYFPEFLDVDVVAR
jgi:hypothetical protein